MRNCAVNWCDKLCFLHLFFIWGAVKIVHLGLHRQICQHCCICVLVLWRESLSADGVQGHEEVRQGQGQGHSGLTLIADVRRSTTDAVNLLLDTLSTLHVSAASSSRWSDNKKPSCR